MKSLLIFLLVILSLSAFADPKVTVFVTLSPAGSFQAVSNKLKGNVLKSGDKVSAEKLWVSTESFKTGIDLRDEHLWKHMQAKTSEKIVMTDVKGEGGKATGMLEVNKIKKQVAITYTVKGEEIVATFNVKNSDFKLPKAEYLGVGVDDNIKVEAIVPFKSK